MTAPEQSPWAKSAEATRRLPLSKRTLQRYIDQGWLDAGEHFLRMPTPSGRAQFLWNIPAIERKLADLTRLQAQVNGNGSSNPEA